MSKKLGVAIIGCGNISGSHIPNYLKLDNVEVRYFCDIIPERADRAVEKYGCGTAVYNYKELLGKDDIDIVSVCTHNDFHAPISIDFMRDGKDVLCEKPAARTVEEALEMQKVAKETGRMLQIGVVNRFCDNVNHVRKLIEDGELGEVYQVYVSFRAHRSIPGLGGDFTDKSKSGGGVLIDWGVHYLDLTLYCLGDPTPLTCSGEAYCKLGKDMKNYVYTGMWAEDSSDKENGVYDVDDFVSGFIRTTGANITFNGAWAQNIGEQEQYIDFMGTKGGIRLYYGKHFEMWGTKDGMLTKTTFNYNSRDHFQTEINAFINCVKTGEKAPSHIDTNIITAKILQGVYDSAEIHKEVEIDG